MRIAVDGVRGMQARISKNRETLWLNAGIGDKTRPNSCGFPPEERDQPVGIGMDVQHELTYVYLAHA